MTVSQPSTVADDLKVYRELHATVGERTHEILKHRRRSGKVRRRGWLVRRYLLVADIVGIFAAMLLAEGVMDFAQGGAIEHSGTELVALTASLPGWIVIAKLYRLYDHDEERTDHSTTDEFVAVFHMITVCVFLLWAASTTTRYFSPTAGKLLIFWLSAVALVTLARAAARSLARRNVGYIQNAVIVGAGDVGQLIAKKLLRHPEYGINIVGFIDEQPKERSEDLEMLALLGGRENLPAIIELFDVERVIVAFSNDRHDETLDLVRSLRDLDVQVDVVPRLYELVSPGVGIHTVEGLALIGLAPPRLARSSRALKRAMDLMLTLPVLVILAPLFLLIAIAIKLDSPGPVFFRQVRMGSGDRTFRIWKFRTMTADAEARKSEVAHLNKYLRPGDDPRMFKITNDPRVTRVGRPLRRLSLDELPQLFNVVLGQMSVVGPRPLILEEDNLIDEWCRGRLNLKPGITGLWQVLGRNEIPFQEMQALDYRYVTSWSIGGDLSIMGRTVPVLLRRRGA